MPLKTGVTISELTPQMALAHAEIKGVFQDYGFACTITSGDDSKHSPHSLHYVGRALDYRTRHIKSVATRKVVRNAIAETLGENFDVVLEPTHIHVEYDPE